VVRFSYAFFVADVKPIVLVNVTSSTGAGIAAASYTMFNHDTQTQIGASNIAMVVSGTTLTTANLSWSTPGDFLLQIRVTFSDGVVDNTLTVFVQVTPVPI
jgi:hypothetical protein